MSRLIVFFQVEDTREDLSKYSFNVYRSNIGTDFECIAQNVGHYYYEDYDVNLYNGNIKYFYKIEIVNNDTGERLLSDKVSIFGVEEPDNYGFAIAEIEQRYLQYVVNQKQMILLKKKYFGQLCTCFDEVRTQPNPKCKCCFGTRYVGGYSTPVPIMVNYQAPEQASVDVGIQDQDNLGEAPVQLWASSFPPISVGDILVDHHNERYRVVSVVSTTKRHFIIRQVLTIAKIQPTDIVYRIPISETLDEEVEEYGR